MNLTALYELKEQLETAAVSGCGLMREDFRLKRAIEQMKPLAAAALYFKRLSRRPGWQFPQSAGIRLERF